MLGGKLAMVLRYHIPSSSKACAIIIWSWVWLSNCCGSHQYLWICGGNAPVLSINNHDEGWRKLQFERRTSQCLSYKLKLSKHWVSMYERNESYCIQSVNNIYSKICTSKHWNSILYSMHLGTLSNQEIMTSQAIN